MSDSQPTKRVLPSRSSRPLRAAMQDGSDIDDVLEAVIMVPSLQMKKKRVTKRKKANNDSSDDEDVPRKTRKNGRAKKEKEISVEPEVKPQAVVENENQQNEEELEEVPSTANSFSSGFDGLSISSKGSLGDVSDDDSSSMEDEQAVVEEEEEEEECGSDEEEDEEEEESSSDEEGGHYSSPDQDIKDSEFKSDYKRYFGMNPRRCRPVHVAKEKEEELDENGELKDDIPAAAPTRKNDFDFDCDILRDASQIVKDVFQPIEDENSKKMTSYFKGSFRDSIVNMPRKQYKVLGDEPAPLVLKPEEVQMGQHISKVENEEEEFEEAVPVKFITTEHMRPKTRYYVHIERNIKVEDSFRLSHVPYIEFADHDYNEFCTNLLQVYTEGIHGVYKGWRKHISDYLLYRLLKDVIPKWKETGNDMMYLWKGIYNLFPNKLTVNQLSIVFPALERRFDKEFVRKDVEMSQEEVQNSISTMFCIHCQQYDCLLHGIWMEELRVPMKPLSRVFQSKEEQREADGDSCEEENILDPEAEGNEDLPKELFEDVELDPCSEECFRLLEGKDNEDGEVEEQEEMEVEPFTGFGQVAFEKMAINNKNPPCQLLVLMTTLAPGQKRTCKEIHFMVKAVMRKEAVKASGKGRRSSLMNKTQPTVKRTLLKKKAGQVDNCEQIHICRHEGPCTRSNGCYCAKNKLICSPYCGCGPDCKIGFPGCNCEPGDCDTDDCPCYNARRECDPRICKSCNSGPYLINEPPIPTEEDEEEEVEEVEKEEVLDEEEGNEEVPTEEVEMEEKEEEREETETADEKEEEPQAEGEGEDEEENQEPKPDFVDTTTEEYFYEEIPACRNINLQRGNYKKIMAGYSTIAGYGCFLNDTAEKGDFIAEYTGEIISIEEGERRGVIYDEVRCSYIFALNNEQVIDANRFGNHIRFANHSDKYANMECKVLIVNGEHRIGFFAKTDIEEGEELLFDYNYKKKEKEDYVPNEMAIE